MCAVLGISSPVSGVHVDLGQPASYKNHGLFCLDPAASFQCFAAAAAAAIL